MANKRDLRAGTEVTTDRRTGMPNRGKPRPTAFTVARKREFLDALALTCNVQLSAAHARIDSTTVYRHKLRDPVFAEQWQDALSIGYDRLRALVLEHGGAGERLDIDPDRAQAADPPPPPFDFDKAIRALDLHHRTRNGGRFHTKPRPVTSAETDAAIMALLGRIKARATVAPVTVPALPTPDEPRER